MLALPARTVFGPAIFDYVLKLFRGTIFQHAQCERLHRLCAGYVLAHPRCISVPGVHSRRVHGWLGSGSYDVSGVQGWRFYSAGLEDVPGLLSWRVFWG